MVMDWDKEMDRERIRELELTLNDIHSDISTLYAMRGEDNLVSEKCKRILGSIERLYLPATGGEEIQ